MEEKEELSTDSGDEMSSDSLGLASHEEDSSDEEAQILTHLMRGRSREEERGNPAISHPEDSLVAAEKQLQTDEQEQLSDPSMVMHKQSAGSGSEQFCDLDLSPPLGLDMNSGHSNTPEHTNCDSLHTSQSDSERAGSEDLSPSSSLTPNTEEHLLIRLMKDNHTQPTGIQIHSTTPTRRGEISANELGTSGSRSKSYNKSTPTLCHPPRTALRPLSRAAQEILEICSVDQTGCEDPDLDSDTTAHTLSGLVQELRLMTKGKQDSLFGSGNSRCQDQHGNDQSTRGRVSEEQKDEEAAAQRDRQSVLLLP
uniref:uncharacterized protein zbbx n=1 Tax=Semicossyphus pulcher TaxID=241346 RepID=UPI0037E8D1FC